MPDGPIHPGLHVALARGRMDEAQVARAIAMGELTSPQRYGNSWLFNLRITGTGSAYRKALDEYVWRDPALYLHQGFLDRCYGLPVIIEHPKKEMLDSKEFAKRVIGSILYPYIREEEVWGIARILDMASADYMREHQLSTSPAVVFRNPDTVNEKVDVGDGKHLLIEGKPSLLDHLAICEEGVWDKGGPPAGVDVTGEKESVMPDIRKDAGEDKLDRVLNAVLSVAGRMESLEARVYGRADAAAEEAEQAAEMRDLVSELTELAEEEEAEAEAELHQEAKDKKDAKKDEDDKDKKEEAKADAEGDDKDEDESKKDEAGDEDKKEEEAKKDEDEDDKDKKEAKADAEGDDEDKDKDKETKADESEDDMARGDGEMPWEDAKRKQGESDSAYSKRADSIAREHDSRFAKRADESTAAYCDRIDAAFRKDASRRNAVRRLNKVDAIADAVVTVAGRLDKLTRRLDDQDKDQSPEDEAAYADAQAKADEVYMALGDSAPRPLRGEGLLAYRIRLARKLQTHSAAWKDSDIATIARADSNAFGNVEKMIYADAAVAARQPAGMEPGMLREIKKRRQGGGEISEFVGSPMAWMQTRCPAR